MLIYKNKNELAKIISIQIINIRDMDIIGILITNKINLF